MLGYFYIAITVILLAFTIIWEILAFNKGQYYPYVIKPGKDTMPYLVRLGINLFIFIGAYAFRTDTKIFHTLVFIFIVFSVCFMVCTTILNYLSYLKSKDNKIIIQTIIMDIIVILVISVFWRFGIK